MGRWLVTRVATVITIISMTIAQMPEPTAVDELTTNFLQDESKSWQQLSGDVGADNLDETADGTAARMALSKYIDFAEMYDRMYPTVNEEWPASLVRDRRWQAAQHDVKIINSLYEEWKRKITGNLKPNVVDSNQEQWLQFAKLVMSDWVDGRRPAQLKSSLPTLIESLAKIVMERNLFNIVLIRAIDEQQACRLTTSINNIVYKAYENIALAQLKAHVVAQWCRLVIAIVGKEGGDEKAKEQMLQTSVNATEAINTFTKMRKQTREMAKNTLSNSERDQWTCDPVTGHTNGTYTELTQLLQGYLENEKDMNALSNCFQNCAYYDYTTSMGCYAGYCKRQKKCNGKLLKCRYVSSDMTVCESDKSTSRRYDYIEYDKAGTFGRNMGCPNHRTVRVESWWRWIFWHCSYCLCLCDDASSPRTDRYWSLRQVVSDVRQNMVVTGVRMVKEQRVIHLQIQQGRLMPYGRIDPSTVQWVPVDSFRVEGRDAREGRDYHTMSYEKRDLDLDDITIDPKHVITGIRWRTIGTHLNLEIQVSKFHWTTGKLDRPHEISWWISSDTTLSRRKLELVEPDVPTLQTQQSRIDSQSDMYVEFTNSDLDKDVGQTTVPFIDTQPVVSDPPSPLSGIGLYHKGQQGYGGYIAPKIISYDFRPHMRD